MNRFVTVGLSIAVAPAILIGIGNLTGSADTVQVATLALNVAFPVGAILVTVGLLLGTARRFRRQAPALKRVAPEPQAAPKMPQPPDTTQATAIESREDIHPFIWVFQALGVAWRHKGLLAAFGMMVAAVEAALSLLWKLAPSLETPFGAPEFLVATVIGGYAYRTLLLRDAPGRDTHAWSTPQRGMLQAGLIRLLALAIIASCVFASLALVSVMSSEFVEATRAGKDPVASRSIEFLARGAAGSVVVVPLLLIGLPLGVLLETAVALALGDVVTARTSGHIRLAAALRRMWRRKFSFVLPSYGFAVLALVTAIALNPVAAALGGYFAPLVAILGFAWWVGFVAVVNRALAADQRRR